MNNLNFDVDIQLLSTNQNVKINKDFVEVNQKKIFCNNVEAIKYGVSMVGSKNKMLNKKYAIEIKSYTGEQLSINFISNTIQHLLPEDHTYYYIMAGLWQYVKKQLISKFIDTLNKAESFSVSTIKVNNTGFLMPYKSWFLGKNKTRNVTWAESNYYVENGYLHIESKTDRKIKTKMNIYNEWNVVVLNTLLHYLWLDNRKEKLALGESI
jgi:hypothetical protein